MCARAHERERECLPGVGVTAVGERGLVLRRRVGVGVDVGAGAGAGTGAGVKYRIVPGVVGAIGVVGVVGVAGVFWGCCLSSPISHDDSAGHEDE